MPDLAAAPRGACLAVIVCAIAPWTVLADLPVHCLRHQVAGDWEFTLGPLGSRRPSCGHKRPDNPNGQPPMALLASLGPTSTRHFSLHDPSSASDQDGSSGSWTMIYDEGFEVAMGDMVYFAFSKFDFVDDGAGGQTNMSRCGQTQIGWYHNTARTQWGCYAGRKLQGGHPGSDSAAPLLLPAPAPAPPPPARASLSWMSSDLSNFLAPGMQDNLALQPAQAAATPQSPLQPEVPAGSPADMFDEPPEYRPWVPGSAGYDKPMPSGWQQSVAEALNLLQLGWRATRYEMFRGKTPRELNRLAGVRRSRPNHGKGAPGKRAPEFSSFLGMGSRVRRAWGPDTFDWRSKDGQNWLEPVVTQGDCGSCYTISTVHMLTARNRIRLGNPVETPFSVSFPLYCSEYNQGCDGGYGFLQSKWAEDVGLVPESCAPFSQGGGSCQVQPGCDLGAKRYRAAGHHYVGGFYGGSDQEQIRQELVSNGPLVISFEPKEDFMYYKSGIYRSGPNKIHQEWEQVDHAVLLAGYGGEDGQQYWTLQNSWGPDWGEGGFFRMARGIDESGCESIAVAANVVEDARNTVLDDFIDSL